MFINKSINCCLGSAHKGLEDVILDEVFDLKMDISKKEGEAITVTYKVIQHHIPCIKIIIYIWVQQIIYRARFEISKSSIF